MKHLNLVILALLISAASFGQVAAISGPSAACVGATIVLVDTTTGGVWSSSSPAVATVGATSGVVTGLAPGTANITYTVGSFSSSMTVTIDATPSAIIGPSSLCEGSTITVTDGVAGGVWTCSSTVIATVGGFTGVVSGVAAGTAVLTYSIGTGCYTTRTVTVEPVPAPIAGPTSVCVAGSVTLSDATGGGTWSGGAGLVTITTGGVLTGVTVGTASITYTGSTGCASTIMFTVGSGSITSYTVSGGGNYCAGGSGVLVDLANSTSGVSYQLYNGATAVGAPVIGTGSALSFGMQTAAGTYTVTGSSGSCSSLMIGSATVSISSLPVLFSITGGGSYCAGGVGVDVGLSNSNTGVNYQLYNGATLVGTAAGGTGAPIDFGLMTIAGTYSVVAFNTTTGCTSTMSGTAAVSVNALPVAYSISGSGSFCAGGGGGTITLGSSDAGVTYQLYMGGVPVGSSVLGTGGVLSFGSVTSGGTYTIVASSGSTGCTSTMSGSAVVTIAPTPTIYVVTGGGSYCAGGSGIPIGLDGSSAGINYTLYLGSTSVTTVAGTGLALSFGAVTTVGTYTVVATNVATGCTSAMIDSAVVTTGTIVTPSVVITPTPGYTVCAGTPVTLTSTVTGGGSSPIYSWTVDGTVVGTYSFYTYTPASGDVVGVTVTSSSSCVTSTTTSTSVTITVDVPTVTATASSTCGGSVTLTAGGATSYSWAPSTGLSCSGCGTPTVLPSGAVTYTVIGTDATGCTGTATVTTDGNRISGHITYSGAAAGDTFKVWLIQFNTSDSSIIATDSTASCLDGGMPYYEFMDAPAGSYMVKAKLNSSVAGTSGYIPTYSLSTPHWDSAASISHSGGADSMHINMVYGTVPTGPGFIAGYVVSGAGRGTSGDIPASGMLIYLKDAAGHTVTYTNTAADGTYSFSHLANNTYQIYPETFKYYTTPSAVVTLAPGNDSATTIDFKQHTSTGQILPLTPSNVKPVMMTGSSIGIYPNPAGNNLNITWPAQSAGSATVVITDMTGREALNTTVAINAASGSTVSLGNVNDGVYLITIKSAGFFYSSKLVKQQ